VYCLDNCFVRFVSDFGCRDVLYLLFCLCNASWLLAMEGEHASLLKKKKKIPKEEKLEGYTLAKENY
jgi:hypothetical protein